MYCPLLAIVPDQKYIDAMLAKYLEKDTVELIVNFKNFNKNL